MYNRVVFAGFLKHQQYQGHLSSLLTLFAWFQTGWVPTPLRCAIFGGQDGWGNLGQEIGEQKKTRGLKRGEGGKGCV